MPSLVANLLTAAVIAVGHNVHANHHVPLSSYLLTFLPAFTVLVFANIIYYCYIYPHVSPIRNVPTAKQEPVHRRFFVETRGPGVVGWIRDVPNNGLVRGFSFLNRELLIATNPETLKGTPCDGCL